MTKQQIVEKVREMETKKDLLNLLNTLKKEDLGEGYHPFTISLINYYCNPNRNSQKRYKHFNIPKKSGGFREISSPVKGLKCMLKYLNIVFQALYEPTSAAMGFVPGRSIADNASVHTNKNYVFNTDLKDFFPSIHQPRIWTVLQLKPFSINKDLASVIAGLCCMKGPDGNGILPQGSPCSPILTNIICYQLDRRLSGLAKRFNLNYTRYADDITFSGDYNIFQEESEFTKEFIRIIEDQHFVINQKKTRLQKRRERQEVTGLVVNEKVNIAKEYSRDLRNLLYIWQKYGYEQAYAKFFVRYLDTNAYKSRKGGMPKMESVVSGRLLYLRMVLGADSSLYQKLSEAFTQLCPEQGKIPENNITYRASYKLNEFESLFNTNITFKNKSSIYVSGKSKTKAICTINGIEHQISVNIRCDSIVDAYLSNPEDDTLSWIKERLYISLCQRGDKEFLLITRWKMNNEHPSEYRDEFKVKANIENLQKGSAVVINKKLRTVMSVDEFLSAFVGSNFDLKTLEEWDKTEKN